MPRQDRKLTKAEKLEAKAARLREAEERAKAEAVNAPAATGSGSSRGWIIVAASSASSSSALAALSTALFVQLNRSRNSQHASTAPGCAAFERAGRRPAGRRDFQLVRLPERAGQLREGRRPPDAGLREVLPVGHGNLRTLIAQYKGKAVATVRGAAVSDVSPSGATVLLILDQSITTAQSPTPRIDRYRAQMTLQHQKNGTWLVSNLVLL